MQRLLLRARLRQGDLLLKAMKRPALAAPTRAPTSLSATACRWMPTRLWFGFPCATSRTNALGFRRATTASPACSATRASKTSSRLQQLQAKSQVGTGLLVGCTQLVHHLVEMSRRHIVHTPKPNSATDLRPPQRATASARCQPRRTSTWMWDLVPSGGSTTRVAQMVWRLPARRCPSKVAGAHSRSRLRTAHAPSGRDCEPMSHLSDSHLICVVCSYSRPPPTNDSSVRRRKLPTAATGWSDDDGSCVDCPVGRSSAGGARALCEDLEAKASGAPSLLPTLLLGAVAVARLL